MNEQVRQLLRRQRRLLLTVKPLQPLWRAMGYKIPVARKQPAKKVADLPVITRPGFELFELVGTNWIDGTERPVAVLWGFHPWKREFVSRYLPEYRLAFVRGNTHWGRLKKSLDQLQDLTFIAWGMSERPEVSNYAEDRNIPLYRMEDGFVRSADLGSRHTRPLSLVLDKQGIYFDASRPSDLEQLLNEHDFSSTPELLRASRELLVLIRNLKISKYNLGSLQAAHQILGPKTRQRVLVIGQVEADASIRHGLGEGWTNHRLIEMAKAENPEAEVIYRPHPDVAQGFRENAHSAEALAQLCRVMTEDVMLGDLFQAVDHVYTLTSLSGFEAVVHGLPVTVVGAPFYAGWGLTDDRMPVPRRMRSLTLDELFCAAYLLYPRYLGSQTDCVRGCLSAILAVTAQRRQSLDAQMLPALATNAPQTLLASEYWPAAFRPNLFTPIAATFGDKLHQALDIGRIFGGDSGEYFQRSMAYLLAGHMGSSVSLTGLLEALRRRLKAEHYAALLRDLYGFHRDPVILRSLATCFEGIGDIERARKSLQKLAFGTAEKDQEAFSAPSPDICVNILKLAQLELRQRNLDEANHLLNRLLLARYINGEVFLALADIARLRFDFASATSLLRFFNRYAPTWKLGKLRIEEAKNAILSGQTFTALESLAAACTINPQVAEKAGLEATGLNPANGELPYDDAFQTLINITEAGPVISRARALIISGQAAAAEHLLLSNTPKESEAPKHCVTLSLAYSDQGKLDEAKALIKRWLSEKPSLVVYSEAFRLAIASDDYEWGFKALSDATESGLAVGDIYFRKILLGVGNIKGSYSTFRQMPVTKTLRTYIGNKYIQSLDAIDPKADSNVVILSCFGPGDEIRFASFYRSMRERIPFASVTFTCEPRLAALLTRSYPDLSFVETRRTRSLASLAKVESYTDLPGSDLHVFADNAGWKLLTGADRVILTTDALGDLIDDYHSFPGEAYLRADPVLVQQWKSRLPRDNNRPLVGISWRSSLTTYSRNAHYLTIEELVPLFELTDAQFVNLQYDECSEELAWAESRYPGRLLHFADLDQYNDLDGVAALMTCLDLVIAPATTVVELAGALGRPTLLLSNSTELHWRKRPGTTSDVWHRSISHVEGDTLGSKQSLVAALTHALLRHPVLSADVGSQRRIPLPA